MKYIPLSKLSSLLLALTLLLSPVGVWADDTPASMPATAPVLITEVQTGTYGSGHAGDEFVELYNTSDQPVDLTGWQLRLVLATSGTLDAPSAKITLAPTQLLSAHSYYVLHTVSVSVPEGVAGETITTFLSSSDKSVVLLEPDEETCEFVVQDAVAWGSAALGGEGTPLAVTGSKEKVLMRRVDTQGTYIDTNDNATDFTAVTLDLATTPNPHTPGVLNAATIPVGQALVVHPLPGVRIADKDCTLPEPDNPTPEPLPTSPNSPPATSTPSPSLPKDEPVLPTADEGLLAPQLDELLPNPAKPQTDAVDEFIELYNPNDTEYDLTSFRLEVGLITKHHYEFPAGTTLAPHSFRAFFSADTKLSLSNTSSQVRLLDPFGRMVAQSDAYDTAKDGQAWAWVDNKWQWSTTPTPNAANVLSLPAVKKPATKSSAAASSTKSSASKSSTPNSSSTQDASDAEPAAIKLSPLHPTVLALVSIFALLYGAYEYRHDVANKLYQLRSYRANRRALRQRAAGRGGD